MSILKNRTTDVVATLVASCVVLLTGCAGIVTPPPNFTLYDLDTNGEPIRLTSVITPHSVDVKAPSWLNNAAMQYRLDYLQPSSRAVYAQSRWVAHPQELIQRSLSSALLHTGRPVDSCRLRLDLDEFIQRFPSPDNSYTELVVRASLLSPRDEAVLARQRFLIHTPTATADAAGGVIAHQDGVRALAQSVVDWLDGLDGATSSGLNVVNHCQP